MDFRPIDPIQPLFGEILQEASGQPGTAGSRARCLLIFSGGSGKCERDRAGKE